MAMRRIALVVSLGGMAASCVVSDPDDPVPGGSSQPLSACHIVSSTPAFDGTGVGVRQPLELQWSKAIDAASVASQVELKALGGESVPFTVEAVGADGVRLLPQRSLWFWDAYAIVIGAGVVSADGTACDSEEIAFTTLEPAALDRSLRPAPANGIAKVGNYVIAASESYRGLQVYDVSDAGAVQLVNQVLTEQSPRGLYLAGDRAYAPAHAEGVLIFDVSAPEAPVQIGRAGTPGMAVDVAEFASNGKRYLAVADFSEGIRLVDVTDAAGPKDLGKYDPTGVDGSRTMAVDVQGDLMAIVDATAGLVLVNIADPAHPLLISKTTGGPNDAHLFDVALSGNIAYTSRGPLGVGAWDVTNPAAPVALGELPGPSVPEYDRIQRLVIDGNDLFAATQSVGVERVALDGTGTMTMAAVQDVPGRAWSVAVDADHIFVGGESGLVVYDRLAASGAAPVWFDAAGHGLARRVALGAEHGYVAAGSRGLQTYALSDAAEPQLVDRDDTPGMTLDVAASTVLATDELVILGDARAGIVLFDRTVPEDPIQVGFIESDDAMQDMQVVGSLLYACDSQTLIVADISDPGAPDVLARGTFEAGAGCSDVNVVGDTVLIGGSGGIGVVDTSDPAQPVWLGWVPMSEAGVVYNLAASGGHLYASFLLTDYEGTYGIAEKLLTFDIADPRDPLLVGDSGDLGGAGQIAVVGDIAFMAGGAEGVLVFDVSDPAFPQLEGAIPSEGNVSGVAVHERSLYVAQANGGLVVVPLGDLPPH